MSNRNYFLNCPKSKTDDDARSAAMACLHRYSQNKSNYLILPDLSHLLNDLISTKVDDKQISYIFHLIDKGQKNKLTCEDLSRVWLPCIQPCFSPTCCLVVVDVQNDFISGSLSLSSCPGGQDGAEVVPVINRLIKEIPFHLLVYTQDWHPGGHCSFFDNISSFKICGSTQPSLLGQVTLEVGQGKTMEQILWPRHCVQGEWGAKLHDELEVVPGAVRVYKGTKESEDAYSGFQGRTGDGVELHTILQQHGVTDVIVAGLAYDVCVAATASDSLKLGYRTCVVEDGCRGVCDDGVDRTRREMVAAGALLVTADEVLSIVKGSDRRLDLLLYSLRRCANN